MADERRVEREDSWREWKKKATMLLASFKEKKERKPFKPGILGNSKIHRRYKRKPKREQKKTRFPDGACQDVEKAEKWRTKGTK